MQLPKRRLRIVHKIAILGSIGIVGLLLAGAIYFVGVLQQNRYQETAAEARAISVLSSRLMTQLLDARRAEKNFLLRRDESYVAGHGKLAQSIVRDMETLKSRTAAAGTAGWSQQIDSIEQGFDVYVKHFLALVEARRTLGLDEKSGLEGRMRGSAHAIEGALEKFEDWSLTAHLLAMRRHEKDFVLRKDARYGEEMRKSAAEFLATLPTSNLPERAIDDIGRLLAAYQRDFFAWTEGMQVLMREEKAMAET